MNKNFLVKENITFKQAIQKLNQTGVKCLVIVDEKNKLLGTLSDGDIRKCLYKKVSLKSKIRKFYNRKPIFYFENNFNLKETTRHMIKKKIDVIPLVDKNKRLIKILTLREIYKQNAISKERLKKTAVLVMAGGFGKRMKPFTDILPKPLLPIENKTAIAHIIENFISIGFKEVFISINYKSKILKAYFEEYKPKIKINFLEEKNQLGTAGAIKFFQNKKFTNLVVINCDVITKFNLSNPIEDHINKKNKLTVFCSSKAFSIPYGACIIDDNHNLIKLNEKPKYNFFINIGIYIINKNLIKFLPKKNTKIDFDELINLLIKKNIKIDTYPVDEKSWVDIGNWNEFKKIYK